MSAFWRWLVGAEGVRAESWSGFGLHFGGSGWLLWLPVLLALATVFVTWCYRGEPISPRRRRILGALKLAAIAWLAVLIARPAAAFRETRIEPSRTALLIDTSASMAEFDGQGQRSRLERFAAAWQALRSSRVLKEIPERQWQIDTFDDELHSARISGEPAPDLVPVQLRPVGRRTDLGGVLRKLISSPGADRLTTVVVATDGRSNVPADWKELIDLFRRNHTTIYAIRVGPDHPASELKFGSVWTSPKVFTFDPVEVRTSMTAAHLPPQQSITVEVYDPERQSILATKTVSPVSRIDVSGDSSSEVASTEVQLALQPLSAGVHHLQVRARTGAVVTARPEPFEVEAIEHHLRVLYVEGYPRFEYRYLKNLLAREKSVQSSCLLVSADPDFVQEGTTPIASFPSRAEELYGFDVVVLGDVDPSGSWWTAAQQELLESFVERRGGGLVVLAGRRWMPSGILPGSPLERLLPVELPSDAALPRSEPFLPVLTAVGRGLAMLHLQPEASDPAGWLSATPGLYWSAAVGHAKPGAEVLMERPSGDGEPMSPLMVLGRYGAGRTYLHGSDDTWRWRKEVGDRYHDGYWLGLLRYLARNKLLGEDKRMLLQADRQLYAGGESVQLRLTALEPSLAAEWPLRVPGVATDGAGQVVGRFELTSAEPNASYRSGSWTPPGLGRFTFAIDAAALGSSSVGSVREAVQVAADVEESRDTSPDPVLLHRLAVGTGGVSLQLEDLPQLPRLLRDRPVRTVEEAIMPLWDTPLALFVLIGLLTAEWLGRKRFGLV